MTDRKPERRGLGRGLSALMADVHAAPGAPTAPRPDLSVPVEQLRPNPQQPRRDFLPEALQDLAGSIRQKGVIQPLIVRPHPGGTGFEIVAGERRWRAAQMAGLHEVPVLVRHLDDGEVIEIAIIENIQRSDLNAVEEAWGYRQLMEGFGHTQERLAEVLGKSRSHIANTLRLLALPEAVLDMLRKGLLTAGHARPLIGRADAVAVARDIVSRGLSVREAERLAARPAKAGPSQRTRVEKDADTRAIEADLGANLKMAVTIDHHPAGEGGVISIRYRNLDQLDLICQVLSRIDINDPSYR